MAEEIEFEAAFDDIENIEGKETLDIIIELDKKLRPGSNFEVRNYDDAIIVNRYYQLMKYAFSLFGVEWSLDEQPEAQGSSEGQKLLYLVKSEIDKKKLDRLYQKIRGASVVELDDDWRDKIHSYLGHISKIVQKADVKEPLRERILSKLHDLQNAVDQRRTRPQKINEFLVELCKGVSSGANELKPAVRLWEKVVGGVSRLEDAKPQAATPALPAPETLGLGPPDAPEE
jgi:hypothetical protein